MINAWNDFRGRVRIYLGSIGRIDRGNGEAVGTGFLIADDLLITNLHVVHELAFGAEKLERGQAVINFQQEYECLDDNGETEIISCIAVHRTLDLALLRINKASDRSPLLLDTATPLGPGIRIAAVGYPAEESDRNPIFIAPVYDGIFGVKRGAPGEILDVEHPIVYHDCSTLGGSSGSPLFSLATARVVGVHRNGVFMYQNEAADAASLECFVREHG